MKAKALYLGILLSLAALAVATYVALTIDRFGWEVDITRWVQGFHDPAGFLTTWFAWMGVKEVAGVVLVIFVAFFWLRHRRIEAIFLILIGIPDLINVGLREVIGRPRPTADLVEVVAEGTQGFSFPSGTTLHMLLFYGFLMYLAGRHISSRRLMYALWTAGTLYILFSGLWVIFFGRHWFTDAIGGYLYGTFYLLVLIAAYRWTKSRSLRAHPEANPRKSDR